MFRTARRSDFDALAALWLEAFHEDADCAKFVFTQFAGYENIYLCEQEDQLSAMLCAVPCTLKGQRGAYLYGVATAKRCRGQGVMRSLFREVERILAEKGVTFCILIPANEGLFSFYRKLGYTDACSRAHFSVPLPCCSDPLQPVEITAEAITACRSFSERFVTLAGKPLTAVAADLRASGAKLLSLPGGYVIFRETEDTAYLEEFYAADDETALRLLSSVGALTGKNSADGIAFPFQPKLAAIPSVTVRPFAVIRVLSDKLLKEHFPQEIAMNLKLN